MSSRWPRRMARCGIPSGCSTRFVASHPTRPARRSNMPTEPFPRGPLLYKHGLVTAHRTSSVDGSPAELWERDTVEMAIARTSNMRGPYDLDARLHALLVDFARVVQL